MRELSNLIWQTKFQKILNSYFSETVHDFLPVIDFRDYASLPNVGYEWNEFMLEDAVDKFRVRVRLIDRLLNFSHYVSSIIVPANSKLKSYEDIVVFIIESNEKNHWTNAKFFRCYSQMDSLVLQSRLSFQMGNICGSIKKANSIK